MWGQQGGQSYWSDYIGGNGGGPKEFIGQNYSLVAVRGRFGAAVDAIQFLFKDINTGQFFETGMWGGSGGGDFIFQAPVGQWIDRIITY